ncbi:unnamed protein product [Adineta steineri]|uniref:UBC core domain-containing protein n=1 Tax=Adineta steineri TaxID=433720 RepID=A0A813YM21_9BILA|nr:unnamed protein product [Adineta steineri]CAF1164731.1 unnamed protein product [Adineta steineri]
MADSGAPKRPVKQTEKLLSALQSLNDNPLSIVRDLQLGFVDGVNELTGILIGPDNSDYVGGHFRFSMRFPPQYPFVPPDFTILTAICHPNVDSRTGTACHDALLSTYDPHMTLKNLLTEIHNLLAQPNYDVPLENDTLEKTREKASEWTKSFAQPSQ